MEIYWRRKKASTDISTGEIAMPIVKEPEKASSTETVEKVLLPPPEHLPTLLPNNEPEQESKPKPKPKIKTSPVVKAKPKVKSKPVSKTKTTAKAKPKEDNSGWVIIPGQTQKIR